LFGHGQHAQVRVYNISFRFFSDTVEMSKIHEISINVLWMYFMVDTLGVARRKQSSSSRRQGGLSRRWDQLAEDKLLVGC
jgi:hypothetical protein